MDELADLQVAYGVRLHDTNDPVISISQIENKFDYKIRFKKSVSGI